MVVVAHRLVRDLAPISPKGRLSRRMTQKRSHKLGEAPVRKTLVLVAALGMIRMENLLGFGMMPMSGKTELMEGVARMAARSVNFPEIEVLETAAALAPVLCQTARMAIIWLELLVDALVRGPLLTLT